MLVMIRLILIVLSIVGVLYVSLYVKTYFDFTDAERFCSNLEKGMSQDDLEAFASSREFSLRIPVTQHYGRVQNSGLCGCMILVQNRVLTDIGEPECAS
jgi:hypothetical protein